MIKKLSAKQILSIAEPERLFSNGDPSIVKDEYRILSKIWHPDFNSINEGKEVFLHLTELKNVALLRKDVIENTYKKRYETNRSFFLDKAKEQIMDRLIVGSAASQERERGKLINILTVTIPELIVYFNFMNNLHIPILTLGKNKK